MLQPTRARAGLKQGASACPDKSGHTSNAELTMIRHGGRRPDLLGPAGALLLGHEIYPRTKKDISMLLSKKPNRIKADIHTITS
jgi:hypothetical protein